MGILDIHHPPPGEITLPRVTTRLKPRFLGLNYFALRTEGRAGGGGAAHSRHKGSKWMQSS